MTTRGILYFHFCANLIYNLPLRGKYQLPLSSSKWTENKTLSPWDPFQRYIQLSFTFLHVKISEFTKMPRQANLTYLIKRSVRVEIAFPFFT